MSISRNQPKRRAARSLRFRKEVAIAARLNEALREKPVRLQRPKGYFRWNRED